MRAAQRSGLRWPTICNGAALYGVCHMRVVDADHPLPAPGKREAAGLKLGPPHLQGRCVRLACQAVPAESPTVEKLSVVRNQDNG